DLPLSPFLIRRYLLSPVLPHHGHPHPHRHSVHCPKDCHHLHLPALQGCHYPDSYLIHCPYHHCGYYPDHPDLCLSPHNYSMNLMSSPVVRSTPTPMSLLHPVAVYSLSCFLFVPVMPVSIRYSG